jgi:hypothetical protein
MKTLLQSLSFEILFFSSQKQTVLDKFLTFFEKNIQKLSGKLSGKTETVSIDTRKVAKHNQAEFQPAPQTDQFLTFFQENSRIFQKNS